MSSECLCRCCKHLLSSKIVPLDWDDPPVVGWPGNTSASAHCECFLFEHTAESESVGHRDEPIAAANVTAIQRIICEYWQAKGHLRHSRPILSFPAAILNAEDGMLCGICGSIRAKHSSKLVGGRDGSAPPLVVPLLVTETMAGKTWDREAFYRDTRAISQYPDTKLFLTYMMISTETGRAYLDRYSELTILPPDPQDLLSRKLIESVGHEQTVSNVKRWLSLCLERHDCMLKARSTHSVSGLPTRLIHIEPDDKSFQAKLIDMTLDKFDSPDLKYATLSYRWGKDSTSLRLLRENMDNFKKGFDSSLLPRVFSEAMAFAVALGIEYIWIDALCIIQDDNRDWRQESSYMYLTYSSAFVNFAATAAGSSLLTQQYEHMSLTIQTNWSKSSSPASFYVEIPSGGESDTSNYVDEIAASPLNNRGWVFQERLLSPRIVHFGAEQIWWECHESAHCEDLGPNNCMSRDARDYNEYDHPYSFFASEQGWHALVSVYSETNLTRPSDRLVAISGIAEAFVIRHGYSPSDYLAGLLLPHLWAGLLWEVSQDMEEKFETGVAPSWSWASLTSKCNYFPLTRWSTLSWGKAPTNDIRMNPRRDGEWHPRRKICKVQLESDSGTPWGPEVRGYLQLRVMLSKSTIRLSEPYSLIFAGLSFVPETRTWHDRESARFDETPYLTYDGSFQKDGSVVTNKAVYFMPLHVKHPIDRSEKAVEDWKLYDSFYIGLALDRVPHEKATYKRVGLLELSYPSDCVPPWWSGSNDLGEDDFLVQHDDGTVEIQII